MYCNPLLLCFFVSASDEPPAIRGRKVEGVGFGNIFGGGPIVLRSKLEKRESVDPSKFPNDPKQPPVSCFPQHTVFIPQIICNMGIMLHFEPIPKIV